MRATVTLATCLASLGIATAAGAEPAVTWDAPADACPDVAAFVARIEALLGGPLSAPGRPDVRATVTAAPGQTGWSVQIRTRTPAGRGERTLAGATCAEVFDAAALIVAMAIDPAAVTGEPGPTESPSPSPSPSPLPSPSPSPSPSPPPPPPVHIAARVSVGSGFGMLPSVEPGVSVDVSASRGPFRGEAGVSTWFERDASVVTPDGIRGAAMSARVATLRACYRLAPGVWTCGAGELGSMRGVGFGATERDFDRSSTWLAAGATALAPLNLSESISIVAVGDGLVPLRRPRFLHDGPVEIYQPSSIVVRVWIGASVQFR